jgi:hypothetical protein
VCEAANPLERGIRHVAWLVMLSSLHDASCLCDPDVHAAIHAWSYIRGCFASNGIPAVWMLRIACRVRVWLFFPPRFDDEIARFWLLFAPSGKIDDSVGPFGILELNLTRKFTCQPVLKTIKVHPGAFDIGLHVHITSGGQQ